MLSEKSFIRVTILHLIAVFFVVFNISDIKIGGFSKLIPLFDLMVIFYFAVFQRVFLIWFIFLLGLWNDALNGNPLGTTSLIYILLVKFFTALNQKLMIRDNFQQIWKQFIAFAACFLGLKWLLLSILNGALYSLMTIFVQFILTICVYVLMHKFFDYLYHKLIQDR